MSIRQTQAKHSRTDSISSQVSDDFTTQRITTLNIFDDAEISRSHIRICIVASAGFFTDGYSLYAISFVLLMLGYAYGDETLTESARFKMKSSIRFGSIFGHVLLGYMADKYGRKKMFGVELIIVVIGTLFSALAGQGPAVSFVNSFVFCRVILGIGIGGDYPISALIISELAPRRFRGRMLAAGFAIFALGMLSAGIVSVIALAAFRDSIKQDPRNLDHVWRFTIGFGAVPAIIALFFRLSIPETPRYLMDVEGEIDWTHSIELSQIGNYEDRRGPKSTQNTSTPNHFLDMYQYFCDMFQYFRQWKNGKYLLATSIIWFCVNISTTGYRADALFNGIIINKGNNTPYNIILQNNVNNVIRILFGYVPGALLTVYLIDKWGRKPILYTGFTACATLFVSLGLLMRRVQTDELSRDRLYYSVSTVTLFFLTFGPHAVAFVVPAELFPTRYRSTAYGLSAAFGKIGVIISYLTFEWLYDVHSVEHFRARFLVISIVYAIFMIVGAVSTILLPETKDKALESITSDVSSNE